MWRYAVMAVLCAGLAGFGTGCARQDRVEEGGGVVIESVTEAPAQAHSERVLQQLDLEEVRPETRESVDGSPVQVSADPTRTDQGQASLRIESTRPGRHVVTVARLEQVDWEGLQRLVYRARVMSQNLRGRVYLSMSVYIQGQMPAEQSQGIESGFERNTHPEWVTLETAYFMQPGQRVGQLELFLILDGTGTVWVDEINVLNTPYPFDPAKRDPAHPRR